MNFNVTAVQSGHLRLLSLFRRLAPGVALLASLGSQLAAASPTCPREAPCACAKLPADQAKLLFGTIPSATKVEVRGSYDCSDKTLKVSADSVQVTGDLRLAAVIVDSASKVRIAGVTAQKLEVSKCGPVLFEGVTLRGDFSVTVDDSGPVGLETPRLADGARCANGACITLSGAHAAVLVREADFTVPGPVFIEAPVGATVIIDRSKLRGEGALLQTTVGPRTATPAKVVASRLQGFKAVVRVPASDKPPSTKLALFEHVTFERVENVVDWGGDRPCPNCAESSASLFLHVARRDGYYTKTAIDAADGKFAGALTAVRVEYGDPVKVFDGTTDKTAAYGAPAALTADLRARVARLDQGYQALPDTKDPVDAGVPDAGAPSLGKARLDVRFTDGNNDGRAQSDELVVLKLQLDHPEGDLPAGTKVVVKSSEAGKSSYLEACFKGGFTLDTFPKGSHWVDTSCRMPKGVAAGMESIDVEVAGFSPSYRLQVPVGESESKPSPDGKKKKLEILIIK